MSEEPFGEEVLRRREKLYMSQAQLAALAEVSRNTISNIERGQGQTDKRIIGIVQQVLDAAEQAADHGTVPSRRRGQIVADRTRRAVEPVREEIARTLDALADAFPDWLFPADSTSPEAVAIRVARHAYLHAARIVRGEAS